MPAPRPFLRVLCGLATLLSLAGCGYTSGVRLPGEARSVGVEVFGNSSPFPEVERELFSCLSTQASRMIAGELKAPGRADVVIRGNIDDYQRVHGVQSSDGDLQESGVRILLHAWLEDRVGGDMLGEVLYFDQTLRYIIGVRESESGARRGVLATLCQEIILDLFNQPEEIIVPSEAPISEDIEE